MAWKIEGAARHRRIRLLAVSAVVASVAVLAAAPSPAHATNRWMMVGAQGGAGFKGTRGIIKIVPDYNQLGGANGLCVRSIYVLQDPDNNVECGWAWNPARVNAPVNFAAWDINGHYDESYDAGYPSIPRPVINGSNDYKLEKVSSTSYNWRMRVNGTIMATKLDVVYNGRSLISSERNEAADSPYGRYWGLQKCDTYMNWTWWTNPYIFDKHPDSDTAQWRTMTSDHDIEIYRP